MLVASRPIESHQLLLNRIAHFRCLQAMKAKKLPISCELAVALSSISPMTRHSVYCSRANLAQFDMGTIPVFDLTTVLQPTKLQLFHVI